MNPRERDVTRAMAGRVHTDAHEGLTDEQARALHRSPRSRRSWARYRENGHPAQQSFLAYLDACADPWRAAQWAVVQAKRATVTKLTDRELTDRYRELLAVECEAEAEDRRLDVSDDTPMLDRARASLRDSAIDAEKSAVEMELAARGLTMHDVRKGGRGH